MDPVVGLPGTVCVLPVYIDVIVGGQVGRAPGDGDEVPLPVVSGQRGHRGGAGARGGRVGEDGVLAGGVGPEIDEAANGAVIL